MDKSSLWTSRDFKNKIMLIWLSEIRKMLKKRLTISMAQGKTVCPQLNSLKQATKIPLPEATESKHRRTPIVSHLTIFKKPNRFHAPMLGKCRWISLKGVLGRASRMIMRRMMWLKESLSLLMKRMDSSRRSITRYLRHHRSQRVWKTRWTTWARSRILTQF